MGIEEERQAFLRELSIIINDLKNIMSNQMQHDMTLFNHLVLVNSAIEKNNEHLEQKLLLYKRQVSYLIEILEGREREVSDYIQKLRNPNYSINLKEEVDGQTLSDIEREISRLSKEMEEREIQDHEIFEELVHIDEEKKQKEHELQILEGLKAKVDKELEERRRILEKQETEIQDKGRKLGRLHKEVENKNRNLAELNNEILSKQGELEETERKMSLMQQKLQKAVEEGIEKEKILRKLNQELENKNDQIIDMTIEVQNRLSAAEAELREIILVKSEINSYSDSESKEFALKQFKENPISLKDELNEPQEDTLQNENSYWEDDMQCLQDNTISSTTQEMSDKEVQTLNTQKSHNRGMKYTVFFTIPFALTGVSLTVIPLIKSTENDTIFLSVGLSFSVLAIVCLVAVTLYSYYRKSVADLELSKKLNDNSIGTLTQDCSMDQGLN